jgi:hypothetical protein
MVDNRFFKGFITKLEKRMLRIMETSRTIRILEKTKSLLTESMTLRLLLISNLI